MTCWLIWPLLAGCGDDLKPVYRIEEPRVLAARAEVVADPGRASPAPGEAVRVRFLVAAPTELGAGFGLAACSGIVKSRGLPICGEAPFATASAEPSSDVPSFEFSVPAELDPVLNPHLLIQGSLCAGERGSFGASGPECDGGDELPVSFDFDLAKTDDVNQNPTFDAGSPTLDGASWADFENISEPCSGIGLPEIDVGSGEHVIELGIPEAAREPLIPESSVDLTRESIQISHFASAGELESAFSNIAARSSVNTIRVRWKPPRTAAEGGLVTRFWFVVRDNRGGADFMKRAVCVLP